MMFSDLLPVAAIWEGTGQDADECELFAEEAPLIAGAVPKRRAEFTTVRVCARRALARLGRPPAPILPGEHREPRWPPGVVGSLTHCDGYRAAALAESDDLLTIGIDAEQHAPLPEGVLAAVSLKAEREQIAVLSSTDPWHHWDRILFSAKESVYKAWYPVERSWLGFEDARITFGREGDFEVEVLPTGLSERRLARFQGRWAVRGGFILTAISVG